MTGIEKLRALARRKNFLEPAEARELDAIADQIEREIQASNEGEKVKCDHAADVSMSAYDLLSQEERDAIAWVREHGGLDAVREKWDGRVDVDVVSRMVEGHKAKRERLKAHALGLERKCAERGETIRELNKTIADMRPRLMPEGMEWMVEAWPRYEDDALVRIGDEISWRDEGGVVNSIELQDGGYFIINAADGAEDWIHPQYFPGERVKRPAPKVLDADGVEIHEGDAVYGFSGQQYEVTSLCEHEPSIVHAKTVGDGVAADELLALSGQLNSAQLDASKLTHRAPVLAADGKPLREGEVVWDKDGVELDVVATRPLGNRPDLNRVNVRAKRGFQVHTVDADSLTHEKPDSYDVLIDDVIFKGLTREEFMRRAKALAERDA